MSLILKDAVQEFITRMEDILLQLDDAISGAVGQDTVYESLADRMLKTLRTTTAMDQIPRVNRVGAARSGASC
jgi:hypothetical protein